MPNPYLNQTVPPNQLRKLNLEDNFNAFIQASRDNYKINEQRLNSLEASMKKVETQVGK